VYASQQGTIQLSNALPGVMDPDPDHIRSLVRQFAEPDDDEDLVVAYHSVLDVPL